MQRVAAFVCLVAVALLAAGCSGKTTGASQVTRTSARLNAQGSCDQACSYYLRFARTADTGWPDRSELQRPYTTPVRSGIGSTHGNTGNFGETASSLLPDTEYRYQTCGRDAGYSDYVCVGPDGKTGATSTFKTPPGDYVFGLGSLGGDAPIAATLIQVASDAGGGSPEGQIGVVIRGGSYGGKVTCLRVSGSRAVIGTADTFFFIEDGPGDQSGYYEEAATNGQAGTCPPVRSTGSSGATIAGVTIHDANP